MDEAELAAELTRLDDALADIYRERRPILEALAEARGKAVLPPPRLRTPTQEKVARCPRCGGRLIADSHDG